MRKRLLASLAVAFGTITWLPATSAHAAKMPTATSTASTVC